MHAADVPIHALSIAHGMAAALACVAACYVVGSALIPRRADDSLGRGESPALVGAALYVLLCWFGVSFDVPVARLAQVFLGAALLVAAVRLRWLVSACTARAVFTRATLAWLSAFGVLYILTYLFTMPPVTADVLPTAWTGNVDLLTYVRYTKYLLRLGPSNLPGYSYLTDVYLQTPAVFYLLGLLSQFFGQDPLRAAMPAQFALTALIGLFTARISNAVFGLTRASALAIAGILISGSFFRYIAGAYYLSTMMSAPVLLYLIWMTVTRGSSGSQDPRRVEKLVDVTLAIRFGAAYVLLLFLYPFLLVAGLAAEAAAIALMLIAHRQSSAADRPWRDALRQAGRTIGAAVIPLALLVACLFPRFRWSIEMVRSLSQPGIAGWPLELISPLALLGAPTVRTDHVQCPGCVGVEVGSRAHDVWALAAFCGIALAAGLLYFWRFRRETSPAQRTLVGLAAGSLLAYCAYFLRVGPSYQQWKLASYSVLILSFALFAGALWLFQHTTVYTRVTSTAGGRWRMRALLTAWAAVMVGGNLLVHTLWDPEMVRFPSELQNVAMVDRLPTFREVTVKMDDRFSDHATQLALYFLPSKRVHVISERFEPSEPLSYEQISRLRPLLIQGFGCDGIGHNDTVSVPDLGCLLFAPPSLVRDTPYPFGRTFLFVNFEGLGTREPQGRWNSGSMVRFKLMADLQRVWVYQDAFVNLLLNPYLPPGTARQRLLVSWGSRQRAEVSLTTRERISLPVHRRDWTGEHVLDLPISITLPDAVAPPWMYAPKGRVDDGEALAVLFEELSISFSPQGHLVGQALDGSPARPPKPD